MADQSKRAGRITSLLPQVFKRVINWHSARTLGNFAVADLPSAGDAGRTAYATDGRKAGETAGNGTGVLVFDDGSNWIAVDTGATVAA